MGNREYQIERTQRDHKEEHEVSSVGPCSLLQEVHDGRMDMQVKARKGDRVSTNKTTSHDQVRVVGAVPIFDTKDETIIVDHAYNKRINGGGREIVEQHHDRERQEHKHDKVLFGLFSGDHKERNITHDVSVDGKLNQFQENTREDTVKFLGITIAHSHHSDNDKEAKQRPVVRHHYNSKGRMID
jgi:hypothetical protein